MKSRYQKLLKKFKDEITPIHFKVEALKIEVHQVEREIDDLAIWNKNSTVHYSHREGSMGWIAEDKKKAEKLGNVKYKTTHKKALKDLELLLSLEIKKKQKLEADYGLPSTIQRTYISNAQAFS